MTMPGADGSGRIVLVWDLPGQRVSVPLTGALWDKMVELGAPARAGLEVVVPANIDDVLRAATPFDERRRSVNGG